MLFDGVVSKTNAAPARASNNYFGKKKRSKIILDERSSMKMKSFRIIFYRSSERVFFCAVVINVTASNWGTYRLPAVVFCSRPSAGTRSNRSRRSTFHGSTGAEEKSIFPQNDYTMSAFGRSLSEPFRQSIITFYCERVHARTETRIAQSLIKSLPRVLHIVAPNANA